MPLEGRQGPPLGSRELDPADAAERRDLYARLCGLMELLPCGQRESLRSGPKDLPIEKSPRLPAVAR